MAQAPGLRQISVEDLDKNDPHKAIGQLVEMLNPALSSSSTALNKGLNIKENLNVVDKDITITVPDQRWETPTYQNSWVDYDTGANVVGGYRIDDDGVVHIQGLVKSGTVGTVPIFTLPVGYRPPGIIRFATTSNGAFGAWSVSAAGAVVADAGSNAWFAIMGSFSAASPTGSAAFSGGGWPLLIDSGQQSPILDVKLGSVLDMKGSTNLSHGGAGIHWEPGPPGKILIRRITRLSPSRQYKIKLLLYPT